MGQISLPPGSLGSEFHCIVFEVDFGKRTVFCLYDDVNKTFAKPARITCDRMRQ